MQVLVCSTLLDLLEWHMLRSDVAWICDAWPLSDHSDGTLMCRTSYTKPGDLSGRDQHFAHWISSVFFTESLHWSQLPGACLGARAALRTALWRFSHVGCQAASQMSRSSTMTLSAFFVFEFLSFSKSKRLHILRAHFMFHLGEVDQHQTSTRNSSNPRIPLPVRPEPLCDGILGAQRWAVQNTRHR